MYDVIFKNGNVVDVKMNRSFRQILQSKMEKSQELVIFQGRM